MGCGIIARKFADAVTYHPACELWAVASKTPSKAQKLAEEFNVPNASNYQQILGDSSIDIIYIATTHNSHFELAKLALYHNKHVVIEKPFTVNAIQAMELVEIAKSRNLFLMEAIWTRFLPSWIHLKKLINEGIVGSIKVLNISFGGFAGPDYIQRLTQPELAGGTTLDLGIYPITFACYMVGEIPSEIKSMTEFSQTGVDEISNYMFRFPSGSFATINASYNLSMDDEAIIYGTRGNIHYPHFQAGEEFTVSIHNGTNTIESAEGIITQNFHNGFIYQLEEIINCLNAGKIETEIITHNETIKIMEVMDQLRDEWGFKYPFE